jgi:acyl-CoA reductase-like NAD-dependent aldehyde dehydrogenase
MLGAEMSGEQPIESKPASPPRTSGGGRRRGRRGGRGRRRPAPVATASSEAAQAESPAQSPAEQIESPIRLREEMPVRPTPSKHKIQPAVPHAPSVQAAVPAARAAKPEGLAIGQTVEEVRQIVESLEQALEQMVDVLRLVELAEQQKFADEHELESLRRALHKLQPPHRERREQGC